MLTYSLSSSYCLNSTDALYGHLVLAFLHPEIGAKMSNVTNTQRK